MLVGLLLAPVTAQAASDGSTSVLVCSGRKIMLGVNEKYKGSCSLVLGTRMYTSFMKRFRVLMVLGLMMIPITAHAADTAFGYSVAGVSVDGKVDTVFKASRKSQPVKVLGNAVILSDEELDGVQGKGVIGAALGFFGGATVAALHYGIDAVIGTFTGHSDASGRGAIKAILTGAGEAAVLGAVLPEP